MQKKVPYVAQLGNMDCSIACMTMLFRYYGLDVDIVDVGQVVHIGRDGVNLTQLKQATQQFGFKCTAYRYNKQKNILDSNLPAVVYSGSHLAVIGSKVVKMTQFGQLRIGTKPTAVAVRKVVDRGKQPIPMAQFPCL